MLAFILCEESSYFFVHYPTRDLQRKLGQLKQGVTIFIILHNYISPVVT